MNFLKEKKMASISLGILVLIFSLLEFYIVYPIIDFERSLRFKNLFSGIISSVVIFVKSLHNIRIKPLYLFLFGLTLIVITFFVSILVTLILSGINDFIKKEKSNLGKENFMKIWGIVAITTVLGLVFILCICVAILPALLVTSMYIKGNMELIYCVCFDFTTIVTILAFLAYARIPIWKGLENAVLSEKVKVSDTIFKKLIINFVAFDILYVLTKIVVVVFFLNFDGSLMRAFLFVVLLVSNFTYEVIKTYSTLEIFLLGDSDINTKDVECL